MDHDVVERVRRAIYDTFAGQGHAPSRELIADLAAVEQARGDEAVAELAAQRHRALDRSGNVVTRSGPVLKSLISWSRWTRSGTT